MNAESIANELLEHGLVALTLCDAGGKQRDRARTIKVFRTLEAWRAGSFDRVGDAETAQLALVPVLKPESLAVQSGSTLITTTPLPPAPATSVAGARERPIRDAR
jgi:hypothetical protein